VAPQFFHSRIATGAVTPFSATTEWATVAAGAAVYIFIPSYLQMYNGHDSIYLCH